MPAIDTAPWWHRCRGLILALLALLLTAGSALAQGPAAVENELLVGFRDAVTSTAAQAIYARLGAARIEELPKIRVHRIRVSPEAMERVRAQLLARAEVTFVERNALLAPQAPAAPGT